MVFALVSAAGFLAFVNERIFNHLKTILLRLVKPEWEGKLDTILQLLSWITGGALSWLVGLDLLAPVLAEFGVTLSYSWIGPVFTAVLVGGGSNLIHDIWPGDKSKIVVNP